MKTKHLLMTLAVVTVTSATPCMGFAVAPATAQPAAAENKETTPLQDSPTILLKAPLFAEEYAKVPIAVVNDHKILLNELTDSLASLHEGMAEGKSVKKQSYSDIIKRLVNTRLIIQEARNIELDKQQEYLDIVNNYKTRLLRETIMKEHAKTVTVDPKEVDKRYRQLASDWKLTSGVFTDEKAAKNFLKAAKKSKDFKQLLTKAVEKKEAEGKYEEITKRADLHPAIVKSIETMKAGTISDITPLAKGFLVFKIDEIRFTENEKVKEQAKEEMANITRSKALEDLRNSLIKKYIKQDKKLIKQLDFEAKAPGIDSYLEDKRPIGEIKDEKPITVGDLAGAVKAKFFHGVEQAVKDKKASKVNKVKDNLIEEMFAKRALEKEAKERKLDQTDEFKNKVAEFEDSILFGTFIEKVVKPEIKMSPEELNAYYEAHQAEYTYPEMLKLEGIGFTSQETAQAAVNKLRQGMDFKWFASNAEGRVEKNAPDQLHFEEGPVLTNTLAEEMRKALTGVQPDEYRLYATPKGLYYVIHIRDIIPSRVQSYQEVEPTILKGVFFEKLNKSVEDWGKKLTEASDIKIYVQFDK